MDYLTQLWLHYLSLPFAGWCFTHQYKNTTQFYFYAALLSSQNTKGLKNRFSVDLGTYWDGTEKQFSLTYPEDGTYLLYVRVHVVGANKMNAGSSVVLNGKGITATYPESIPLAKDWDRWRSAVFIVPTASGTYDYSLQGSFQGSRADANYGSSVTISIFKLSSATDFA